MSSSDESKEKEPPAESKKDLDPSKVAALLKCRSK